MMGKQKIANTPDLLDYLLDENQPITERLAKYNEYDCLAFVRSPKWLYPGFNGLFKDNKQYQQEFEKAKKKAISTIHKKQQELSYEGFLRYLFFELEIINDHYGSQSITTFEARDQNEPFVYNIAPLNDKVKAEIFEKVAVEHIKTTDGKGVGNDGAVRLNEKSMFIGYNSFETLKKRLNDNLNRPFAEKPNVIERFYNSYIEPLKKTNTSSRLQNIYKALKSGTPESHLHSHNYAYYTDKAKVIELVKFEEYLNSLTNNEPQLSHKQKPENEVIPPQQTEPSLKNNGQANTIELEKCIHLIGYWLNTDEKVIDEILDNETDVFKNYVEPFRRELNRNLLNKDTLEGKEALINYYIFEFWELQGFYKRYNEILFCGSLHNYSPTFYEHTNEAGANRKLDKFENYVVNSWQLFDALFNEIQLCCIKYQIDFYKVCHSLNFSTEYFDSGITLAFENKNKETPESTFAFRRTRDFIETILTDNSASISYILNEIKEKYNSDHTLKLFRQEYIQEVRFLYQELLLSITDDDLTLLLDYYKKQGLEIPTLHLDDSDYQKVKLFVRNIKGNRFVSNVNGFNEEEMKGDHELLYVDKMLKDQWGTLSLLGVLEICNSYPNFENVWRIEQELIKIHSKKDYEDSPPQQNKKEKPELTINQIALKYAYEGLQITRENGNAIAKQYKHNSGEKLFQRFTYYSSAANRKGKPNPCTPKKLDNKIKLIESVIVLLPDDKKQRAKDEVSILKKINEAEYQ